MESTPQLSLLSKLESSDLENIYSLFSDYLLPLSDLVTSQKSKLTSKRKQEQTVAIRSLAKQFLPFLNKSLSILPKSLSNPQENQRAPFELFDTYKLCLDCLDVVSSQLSCKPYTVQIQRLRFIYCLVAWERYEDAASQGFGVLERLRGTNCGSNKRNSKREVLPKLEAGDLEFAKVVVEVVVVIIKCVATSQAKDCGEYKRVLGLVEEIRPWFGELDVDAYEKFHRFLVTYLSKCAIFLVGGLINFGVDLVSKFYVATLTEYENSSMKDQIYKFSQRICSSLLLIGEGGTSLVVDMLILMLKTLGTKCKVDMDEEETKFVELVSYCANKCQLACTNLCCTVARHLNGIAGELFEVTAPINIIVRLYASGLYFTKCNVKLQSSDVISSEGTKDGSAIRSLLDDEDKWQDLAALLHSLEDHFHIVCKDYCAQKVEISMSCRHTNLKAYLLSYFDALKFLCQPLADLISSEKKQMVDGTELASVSTHFSVILDAFHQFCDIYLFLHKNTSKGEKIGFDDDKTVCTVIVAAFVISIRTELSIKKSVQLSKHIIVGEKIQPQGLKYLFISFYNIGVVLYRNKRLKEASVALKLCCRASWTRVVLLCKMFEQKSGDSQDFLSEEAIVNFVTESCTRCAFFLDVLHQCGSHKIKKVIVGCLENWCVAANLFAGVPAPIPIVKQWVKIAGKLYKDANLGVDDLNLYSSLPSSTEVSKKMGIILEQELLAYEDIYSLYPELCKLMQMKICDFLLKDVYTTKDCCLEKSRILLKKGRALRASGVQHLKDCIQCLSEAISLLNNANGATHSTETTSQHHLAAAYCLRAFCFQEAEPNSEQVLQDISFALNLWLSMPDHCYSDDGCTIVPEHTMMLLHNIIDLLSVKGDIRLHNDIYKLVFRLYKWKNVELQNGLTLLWQCRRLTHALCVFPINEAFIGNLSEHCGERLKSVDFWTGCLKESRPLLVGFKQNLSLLPLSFYPSPNHECPLRSEITAGDVKEAASELISNVPLSSQSAFLVGHLYYDLCEKLILRGQLFEALSYAKDAHQLRSQLFQEKFKYSVEQQVEKCNDSGDDFEKHMYNLTDFQVSKSVACVMWSIETVPRDVNGCDLSPWNVLQCYLESTLQFGVINELIGNGKEAETLLLWGKSISSLQNLSLFAVAFSSALGRLYCKKRFWDLAEKELQIAKQTLVDSSRDFSCLKCRLMQEVTVDQQLGDLHQSHFDSIHRDSTIERLSYAQSLYQSGLHKLNLSEWKNPISCPIEASDDGIRKACFKNVDNGPKVTARSERILSDRIELAEDPKKEVDGRRYRKTRGASRALLKEQCSVTRSNCLSLNDQSRHSSFDMQNGNAKQLRCSNVSSNYGKSTPRESLSEVKNSNCDACISGKMKCWQCLPKEVMESGLLNNYISLKWEIVRRLVSLRVLNGLGKCLESFGQIHQAHDIILQSISTMFSRNPFYHSYSSSLVLLDLIGKEFVEDVFTIERATLLYNVCLFSLKGYHSKNTRAACCDAFDINLEKVVGWLMLAFVLCREVPILFQEVSRLLATISLLSASNKDCCLPFSENAPSHSQWTSYFHQASLGTHISYKFFSNMSGRCKSQGLMNAEVTDSTCIGSGTSDLSSCRVAPESIQHLEKFVTEFFNGLPSTPVVCISLIGGASASLLNELLLHPSSVHAWMLLSRFNSRSQPIVLLLPVDSILEENFDDMNSVAGEEIESQTADKKWHCPWGSTVVDDVAPAFKLILEENFISSNFPLPDTKENRSLWWMRRKKIDQCLAKLLRNLEDSWLGPWRYVLLGEWSNCNHLDSIHEKLVHDLKTKCNIDVNETLLKVIIGGGMECFKGDSSITQLCPKAGCYIGAVGYSDQESCRTPTNTYNGAENQPCLALRLIHEAVNELEGEDNTMREPIILVLDSEVQMLPWENIPILRHQEVYRMPSVGSISATLNRSYNHEEDLFQIVAAFPLIDPLDAFYLLNPSGDLNSTQLEFESWFRDQNLEGKAGSAPTAQELAAALKSHDLFIYFGHGSGAQYISKHEIQKLEKCAATLLMGCSSGSLFLNGCYIPQGTSLSYLLAGSPVIVANLWEVTDKDINRFAKAMLDAWLKERSSSPVSCAQCNSVAREFEALNIKGKAKKVPRMKATKSYNGDFTCNNHRCDHGKKIGSFMAQAREACTLPFLIGASPVCYGVPTGIRRKKHL